MNRSGWKNRFTEEQLERKRLADRLAQRRTRSQSKKTVAELEEKLGLLLRGENSTLITRLTQENAELRATVSRHQSKMEAILLCTRESLEDGEAPHDEVARSRGHSQTHQDSATGPTVCPDHRGRCQNTSLAPRDISIFCRAAAVRNRGSDSADFSTNDMLECLIAWNLEKNNGLKPGLMIDVLALDKAPLSLTAETIRRRVSSKLFHQRILNAVLHDQHLQAAEADSQDQGDAGRLSEIEFQRRNILFCSYRVTTLWRHLYSSKLVYLVYFWAVYRFFTFLAFPTEENMRRCPTWLRPTNTQWLNYHPVWIDFIFWPRLRDRLSMTWPSYESNALLFHCVRTLEIDGFQGKDPEAMLFLQPDGSGIEVNDAFKPIFHSLQHFRAREEFAFFYPALAPYMSATSTETQATVDEATSASQPGQYPELALTRAGEIGCSMFDNCYKDHSTLSVYSSSERSSEPSGSGNGHSAARGECLALSAPSDLGLQLDPSFFTLSGNMEKFPCPMVHEEFMGFLEQSL